MPLAEPAEDILGDDSLHDEDYVQSDDGEALDNQGENVIILLFPSRLNCKTKAPFSHM